MADRMEAEPVVEGLVDDRWEQDVTDPPDSGEQQSGAWRFPSRGESLWGLRQALRPFLTRAGLADETLDDLVLAACEAAANSVEHARESTELFFDVRAESDGTGVMIVVRDYGRWETAHTLPGSRGHGLRMMMTLAAVSMTSGPVGTSVTLRRLRS